MAGTHEGVLMVESEAKELSEAVMLGAVNFGHDNIKPVIDAIIDLAKGPVQKSHVICQKNQLKLTILIRC